MKKISYQKKNTSVGFNWCFDPIIVFFFEMKPTLAIFLAFLKKITTTGSSHFLSPNGQGSSFSFVFRV